MYGGLYEDAPKAAITKAESLMAIYMADAKSQKKKKKKKKNKETKMPPQASGVASEFRWVCEMVSFSGELLPSVVSFKKVLKFAARRKGAKEEKVAADACDAVPVQPALEPVQPALEPVVKRSKRKRYRFPIPYIFVSRLGPLDQPWEFDEMLYQSLFKKRSRNAANHWLYRFYVTHQSCNAKRYWPIGLCQLT